LSVTFPGESAEYRAARDRLLEHEIELRRAMEAVAVARRALPPRGEVPEDYAFQGEGADGTPTAVRLSELFVRGKDSLVIYRCGSAVCWARRSGQTPASPRVSFGSTRRDRHRLRTLCSTAPLELMTAVAQAAASTL
jgi:predicted dithiol-disulfide oxidoreductase (DUF899 family)